MTIHNLHLTSDSTPQNWNGPITPIVGGSYYATLTQNIYIYPNDVAEGNDVNSSLGWDGSDTPSTQAARFGFAPIPQTPGESIKTVKVWYANPSDRLLNDGHQDVAGGIKSAKLTINGSVVSTLDSPPVTALEGDGGTWWHYVEFTGLDIDISSADAVLNFIELDAGDYAQYDQDWYITNLYIEASTESSVAPYTSITVDDVISDSSENFAKSEGGTFEVELWHDGTVPEGTAIDFTIEASTNYPGGGFDADHDIDSITVNGVLQGTVVSGTTYVLDHSIGLKTENIVIKLATDAIAESTEYFRVVFATTDSLDNSTKLSTSQAIWNPDNLAQTWDMQILNAVPLDGVSVAATQNGTEDGTPVQFTFTRSDTTATLSVNYRLSGTALPGIDFTGAQTGTVNFGTGVSSVVLSLPTIADSLVDPVNILRLRIDPSSLYDIVAGKQFAEATIVGDGITSSEIITQGFPGNTVSEHKNLYAFAALKEDGSVVTWGLATYGGDSSGVAGALSSGVTQIFSTVHAFAALKQDGSVVTWGSSSYGGDSSSVATQLSSGVSRIFSTSFAFAALKEDGSVVTWGDPDNGGDSSSVATQLESGVSQVFSTSGAFAALKADGSVVTWGDAAEGGDSSSVAPQLSGDVSQVFSTGYAFAALKEDGSVVAWGVSSHGGDSSSVATQLSSGVSQIFSTFGAFAALKEDGSVVTWGLFLHLLQLAPGVSRIFSTGFAFAALKEDGSVVTWGDSALGNRGGDSSSVVAHLTSGVSRVFSASEAFAALKEDGSVVTWGNATFGGDSSSVASQLSSGVIRIFAGYYAFAALKQDGSVVTWGIAEEGGDSSSVATQLGSGVTRIFSNSEAFAALKEDGSVVTWGESDRGGDSSSVVLSNVRTISNIETLDTLSPTSTPGNTTPTLDSISNLTINEDATFQTVSLTGITAGGSEVQPLRVTASSNNTELIPNPTVTYTSAQTTGTLTFVPTVDKHGEATITVTVEDGGLDANLSTTEGNATFSRTFIVTVTPDDDPPTINPIANLTIDENAPEQTVNLTGISSGGGDSQPLRVTAISDDTGLIPHPTVGELGFVSNGSISGFCDLKFTPVFGQYGTATITVTVEDGGLDGDLSTTGDNGTISTTFVVTVNEVIDIISYYVLDIDLTSHGGADSIELDKSETAQVCFANEFGNPRPVFLKSLGVSGGPNTLTAMASISSKLSADPAIVKCNDIVGTAQIDPGLTANYSVNQKMDVLGTLSPTYMDKFAGDFGDYECSQKLFPISDIPIVSGLGSFVGPLNVSTALYSFIDEGIFTGDYDKKFGHSILMSDDKTTFIHPSSIHTSGQFEYKCGITTPLVMPEYTRLRVRASAPLTNLESRIAPRYTIEDIKFEDPSGNLIVEYDDIVLQGDADHNDSLNYVNFTTYSSNSKTNKTSELYSWQSGYPLLQDAGVYSLYFKVTAEALDDPFDTGFDLGFEDNYILPETTASGNDYLALDGSPLSTRSQHFLNPIHAIKISALEICNSGGYGPRIEDRINLYTEVRSTGHRIERSIYPSFVPVTSFDTNIYPSCSSIWYANNNPAFSNETVSGALKVLESLNNTRNDHFIVLNSTDFADSGKLTLKMSHDGIDKNRREVTNGDFNFAFDGAVETASGAADTCVKDGAFNREKKNDSDINDGFFVVDCVTLKVRAKKQVGSRDYAFDVVGYSDDKILNVTSAVGGFLQNVSGVGTYPYPASSGFAGNNDLGMSLLAVSENDQFYKGSGNNAGGDHYSLAVSPVVSGTDFEWYDVPLKVYDDAVTLGKSRDYTMSSMFENMYLDIFPLPSGATIANIYLSVRYKPQNALRMITEGGEFIGKIADGRSEGKLYPISRQANDSIINAGSGYAPLSSISGIPHAYTTPATIKSNYSRRWRGMELTVNGPFDVDQFSFSFYNPLVDFPFLSGFYDFDYDRGLDIIPRVGNLSGTLTTTYSDYRFKNLGWRHTTNDLFADQLPGYTGDYQTTDWSSLSNGGDNFQTHPLYGQIADAFNNVVRISGHNSNINFGDIDIVPDSGFSMYVRFSPDANVSGVGYDLFESGCLFSKWDTGKNLEFALGYASGFLRGYARDNTGTVHTVQDSAICSGYQYPLSVILTYNDDNTSGLKLYTDNEFEPNWNTLRASSVAPCHLTTSDSDFVIGHSTGSGVGFNMFVSEMGISNSGNIVYSNADATKQQVTAQKFLENNRVFWWDESDTSSDDSYKLWDYIDEDTRDDWTLGAFKYCAFDIDFDQLQKRTGRDLISFNMVHDGSGYSERTNLALPTNLDSGVAYHTQFENDFLRLHLSDTADNFYSVFRRITKDLPRGYKFADRALVVETVLEHNTSNYINWNDGNIGPKLIVSLYTKNQDPYWDAPNWGLINRDIHYLEPSSCFMRVDSKFTYDSICNQTEEWASFPTSRMSSEFKEKYFSQDVDDMFLQYDLVYPSGPAFESRIDIHTAHIRMDDAYINVTDDSGILNLSTSGGFVVDEELNLYLENYTPRDSGIMNLYTVGPLQFQVGSGSVSGLNLYTSGAFIVPESMNLFTENFVTVSESGLRLTTSGTPYNPIDSSGSLSFSLFGKAIITSQNGDQVGLGLTALNTQTSNLPDDGLLDLYTFGSTAGTTGVQVDMPIFMLNEHQIREEATNPTGTLNLQTVGSSALFSRYRRESMNLSLFNNDTPVISEAINFTLYGDNLDYLTTITSSGDMNLYVANYGGTGSDYLRWFNENYGVGIDVADNDYASKLASDEIRGVDLIGYGTCDGDSPSKAIDKALITDGTVWREETCNEGGIFRAKRTYTNSDAGYSSEYYDIRKYEGLIPGSPYLTTLKVTTGSTDSIDLPRDWEEWEYGTNSAINFSGVKFTGEEPRLDSDDPEFLPSGRNAGDKYGKSISVDNDLMAVGSPFIEIPDDSGHPINSAGSVFLYRRNTDVPGEKADWEFADQLMLPSGYRKDYSRHTVDNLLCYPNTKDPEFCVSGQRWHIGQEGREFGHSVDLASNNDGETVVIGAPGAKWDRTFDDIVVSGLPVCMMLFVDQFNYNESQLGQVLNIARKHDVLYRHFAAPWSIDGVDLQVHLDIKVLVYQLHKRPHPNPVDLPHELPQFSHTWIDRKNDEELIQSYIEDGSAANRDDAKAIIAATMLETVKESFHGMFTHDPSLVHNNIPPIVGIFKDNSPSTGDTGHFESVVDDFISYYHDYAYESGVLDSTTLTADRGYVNTINEESEVFYQSTIDLLDRTLATGNLITNDALKYITSEVGQELANPDFKQFQIPPGSGGRVYIFEKESGVFNLVQSIASSTQTNLATSFNQSDDEGDYAGHSVLPNRFGHSVSISDNREVIAIGSPYATTSCEILERDESENTRMYNSLRAWLVFRGKTDEIARYDDLLESYDVATVQSTVYNELNQGDKFYLRSDGRFWENNPIALYKNIYTYGYGNIPYTGTWQFIPGEFAASSRLGYSTAVSEDGDTVAFGAPTDSFNEFDDTNVWYRNGDTWASYVNAGAVRTFGSRRSYPHSGVIEYYKFGNMDRNIHKDERDAGYYDQMGEYFLNVEVGDDRLDLPFRRTEFEDLEIPQDVGLAFIITPEVDATSDEIVGNIKEWLALGDRTLVIVGNDPRWEESGIYGTSNDIANKLLAKLDSTMRIHEAREESESINQCISPQDVIANKYNVVASKVPAYSHGTNISRGSVFAKGVGDIRINLSGIAGYESGVEPVYGPCGEEDKLNFGCVMPLTHGGDLRAEWNDSCTKTVGKTEITINYKVNWPFRYGNPNPSDECDNPPVKDIDKRGQDITPILTAAEYIPPSSWYVPEEIIPSGNQAVNYIVVDSGYYEDEEHPVYRFEYPHVDNIEFSVSGDNISSVIGESAFTWDNGTFSDPDPVIINNEQRDGILQGTGVPINGERITVQEKVDDISILASEEIYHNDDGATTSKGYLIASLLPESDKSLGSPSNNNDQNVYFYNNLLMKDCDNKGMVYQLGEWTGRTSFTDAYGPSSLTAGAWGNYEQSEQYKENVVYDVTDAKWKGGDGSVLNINNANVLWIANPTGSGTADDMSRIKTWLDDKKENGDPGNNNRKLVITYGKTGTYLDPNDTNSWIDISQQIADNVWHICSGLGLTSRPWPAKSANQYMVQSSDTIKNEDGDNFKIIRDEDGNIISIGSSQQLGDVDVLNGCPNGYLWYTDSSADTKVDKISIRRSYTNHTYEHDDEEEYDYIPISGGQNTTPILWFNEELWQSYDVAVGNLWSINAAATGNFPVEPGSGYRIFYNWVSESENEKYSIKAIVRNVGNGPSPAAGNQDAHNFDDNPFEGDHDLLKTGNQPSQTYVDIRVPSGTDNINIAFLAQHSRIVAETSPETPRILSVSGCLLPIIESVETTPGAYWYTEKQVITYSDKIIPASSGETPGYSRPVMNYNDQYCPPGCDKGGQWIQDGPVVVAEQVETFSSFSAGNNRSKIVVIADSTMIQGQCPQYRDVAYSENQAFIRSLYPHSPYDYSAHHVARRFIPKQKLLSPERGSAAKLFAVTEIPGLVSRYGNFTGYPGYAGTDLENYTDQENVAPGSVSRPGDPTDGDAIKAAIDSFKQNEIPRFGVFPRYSGDYLDAGIGGGMPEIMLSGGKDHIDFDENYTGYPGDLFGYSIDIHNNKLVVGSPFAGYQYRNSGIENIVTWSGVQVSGEDAMMVNGNGGAGAVYYFEKTGRGENVLGSNLDWEFKRKIKPSSINIGLDDVLTSTLTEQRGTNYLPAEFVAAYVHMGDQFGQSVSIDEDFLAIGAPNHGFETLHDHIYSGSAAFIRKEFNAAFDIPQHNFYNYDLGSSGVRYSQHMNYGASGKFVLNNGAVFTYRHQMTDWPNRTKEWQYAEKIFADGYSDRNTDLAASSGTENDFFGTSVSINRAGRGDSDYTLAIGSPNHKYGTSGNIPQHLEHAGAAYVFDAMLRDQGTQLPNSDNWIEADVFGDISDASTDVISVKVYQNIDGDSITYETSGIIFSNINGNIFLEASGFDPAASGFAAQRPYVESVIGEVLGGTATSGAMNLFTSGKPVPMSGFMNLVLSGDPSAYVYNNMNLYTSAWNHTQVGSGVDNDPFYLTISGAGLPSNTLNLCMSGQIPNQEQLNLRVRGK